MTENNGAISITSAYAEIKGTKIYYEIAGEGHPIILIHPGFLDRRVWDDQFKELAKYYKVIRYDTRGYGKSGWGDEPYSDSDDLFGLMKFLDIDKSFIIGSSLGGAITLDFTLEHPEMVDSIVIVSSAPRGRKPSEEFVQSWAKFTTAIREKDIPQAFEFFKEHQVMTVAREKPDVLERIRIMFFEHAFFQYYDPIPQKSLEPPAFDRVSEIRIPTLIIVGAKDMNEILRAADIMEKGISGSRKIIINNASHMLNMERPREFNQIILDFLKGKTI